MPALVDFIEKLPANNQIAFGQMLNVLSEDDAGFIEDYLIIGSNLPGNIINKINQAFIKAGFPQFNWDNCQMDTSNMCFDSWFDEIE
ncbi:hypothetical protein [Dehalobacter sp. 4CP]|uniref:hypothetical protein n=1 Tax=Dehalobacter sp. CP TaxID=2594474 RepID=UPI0039EC69AB